MHVFGELDKLANKQAWPTVIRLDGHSELLQSIQISTPPLCKPQDKVTGRKYTVAWSLEFNCMHNALISISR